MRLAVLEDELRGSPDDTLHGGDGDDDLYGQAGEDDLVGYYGNDFLSGGPDHDTFSGGPHADRINSIDGIDEDPDCGGGLFAQDNAFVDALDDPIGCEIVDPA